MLILGVETSCDDTAAAVLRLESSIFPPVVPPLIQPITPPVATTAAPAQSDGQSSGRPELTAHGGQPGVSENGVPEQPPRVTILANLVRSQAEVHTPYGGVVPELASRRHLENIHPVVTQALEEAGVTLGQLDLLAATRGPGLVGSLLVGFNFTKALSLAANIPWVGVDHIAGHLASVFLTRQPPSFPYLALTVSGGHSNIFVVNSPTSFTLQGRTRDDAAGEAFDKVAKLLHLGYPGGPAVSRLATEGDSEAFAFPRARLAGESGESFDFSFSGLKTAVANQVRRQGELTRQLKADICASFQEAVVEILVEKTLAAAGHFNCRRVVLSGGVAANPRLRQHLTAAADERGGLEIFMPEPAFCTDNAAMIAMAGYFHRHLAGHALDLDVYSRFSLPAGQG